MFGINEGDVCGRDGCEGNLERKIENCSCHITPPCWACTNTPLCCSGCGVEVREEHMNDYVIKMDMPSGKFVNWKLRELDRSKIDWHSMPHTHFSMIQRGVFPIGTSREAVEKLVKGTFGGRFNYFGNGKFEYIAYTD